LTKEKVDPSEAFWTIKHGVKASGMPAWGKSMSDEDIWNMVGLLQQLPKLNAQSYRDMVASSEGHSHGPAKDDIGEGEKKGVGRDEAKPHEHHMEPNGKAHK
jgi:hypothetical protein